MNWILSSGIIDSQRAKEMGLVSEVFDGDLHAHTLNFANSITQKASTALIAAKQCIKESENLSMEEGIAFERKVFYPLFDTPAVKEGVDAFVNKRAPDHYDL